MKFNKKLKFVGTSDNDKSKFVICGVPYDETSTFRHGSQKAPMEIRKYSDSIETFSVSQEKDLMDYDIFDIGDMIFIDKKPLQAIQTIEKYVTGFINDDKKVIYIGGEHLITLPIIKKYYEKYIDLKIIYFDAHADMREDYEGNKLSHSTVARRMVELIGEKNFFMFGVRSFEKNEYNFIKKNKIFCENNLKNFRGIIKRIKKHPIYISLDLDIFDPSCLPGVGNPEAGGIYYHDFTSILPYISLFKKNIVALDVLELMPDYDLSGGSNVFAAKIIRELILSIV